MSVIITYSVDVKMETGRIYEFAQEEEAGGVPNPQILNVKTNCAALMERTVYFLINSKF